ncbi:EAL domain-containing protein [Oxalobacteraceae bacterium OM1]|nr:EAL domain-containing protein [Oxalobacteraceae bacterium OM1]
MSSAEGDATSGHSPSQLLRGATSVRMADDEAARLRAMFDQAPGFIAILRGPDLIYEVVNRAYYELVGQGNLIGRPVREALPELEAQGYIALAQQVYASGKPFVGHEMPVKFKMAPDAPMVDRYLDLVFQPLCAPDGSVSGVFLQGQDVTEQKRMRDALRQSEERWKFAIEGARDGVWDWDVRTNGVVYSRRYKEILGYSDTEMPDRYEEWVNRIHPEDRSRAVGALQDTAEGSAPYHSEYRLRCKDGVYKWVLSRGIVVTRDEHGHPTRLTGTMTDISDRKETEETIWRHASLDALTGLPNRRLFRDRLEQELRKAHRQQQEVALLFIDLDHFKEANDLLGHDAGDQLLAQVATRLLQCVRDSDTVARLGGDEFTVILTDLRGHPHVERAAQKIIASLAEPFQLHGEVAHVTASIGITLYPGDATEPEALIRNADQAMYAAKHAGRNRFRFFTKSMQKEAQLRVRLARDLRQALAAGQLEVHFQPVIELPSRRITKAEALLRWRHPKQGFVGPSQFIPIAEESGLIHAVGDWVFAEAAMWSERWAEKLGRSFEISVNRSPVQFLGQSNANWAHVLKEKRLPRHSIAVEITEGVLLNASTQVAEALFQYRDAGIHVALDDFGTGYSSLAYLKHFHIDYLKIDQSFVHDIDHNDGSRAIAESMIAMAHRLDMQVIAEGIERPEQEAILRAAGCDFGQGFLFSRAVPPQRFEQLLCG